MSNDNESKCPVMHGALTTNSASGTSNKDWWPNQLDLSILHQHDQKSDPMDDEFDYKEEFQKLDFDALKKDLNGKELSKDKANRKPKLNSKNKVTTANLIERQIELKKTSSKINCL